MKRWNLVVVLVTLFSILLVTFWSCVPPAPQPVSPVAEASAKAPAKSDWASLLGAAKVDKQVTVYAAAIGAAREAMAQSFGEKYGIGLEMGIYGRGAVPGANDLLPGEQYQLQKAALMKVAAELFKNLIQ